MRAITPVVSVLLIIVLSVALVGLLWIFVTGTFTSLSSSGTSTVSQSLTTISSCMKIESVAGNQVSLRNCGEGSITQGTLGAYLDDIPLNVTMSPAVVNKDGVGTVTLSGLWSFNLGGHTLRMANPRVVTEEPVNAVLPDSTVLSLSFDEGWGNIAYDGSAYGNNGTLVNRPLWASGKYGSAMQVNGSANPLPYVDVPNFFGKFPINDASNFTFSMWINENPPSDWASHSNDILFGITTPNQALQLRLFYSGNGGGMNGNQAVIALATTHGNNTYIGGINTPGFFLPIQSWHFVVVTHLSGSPGVWTIYVDGVQRGQNQLAINSTAMSGQDLYVAQPEFCCEGTYQPWPSNYIDEVRIFNQALTPDQIISLRPVSYD